MTCLAGAAAVAVAVPVLLNGHLLAGRSHATPHTVTVHPGGGHRAGLIAYGTVDGKPWQVRATKPGAGGRDGQCWTTLGTQGCGAPFRPHGADPANLQVTSAGTLSSVYGAVAGKVAYVTANLAGGTHIRLDPVTVYGVREVAFAAPTAAVTSVTAYSGTGEIATAVPLHGPDHSLYFGTWLRPGQQPLPSVTRLVGSGEAGGSSWRLTAYQGPWGNCLVLSHPRGQSSACFTVRPSASPMVGWQDGPPTIAYGQTSPAAAHVMITLSDGKHFRVPAVSTGTRAYFVFVVGKGVHPVRWAAYDGSRQQIAGGKLPKGI